MCKTKRYLILHAAEQDPSAAFYSAVLGRDPSMSISCMTGFETPGGAVLGLMPVAGTKRLLGAPS